LVEEYFAAVKEWPDSWQLQRLANEILREELTSTSGHKAKKPYSFLSDRQMETRERVEFPVRDVKRTADNRIVGRRNISYKNKDGGNYYKKQVVYDLSGSV
jgi:hypothetical protein